MKKILLTLSSVGALALASCSTGTHMHETATGATCPHSGNAECHCPVN